MSPRRPKDDRAPSQVDVAQLAGVSTQTVSRVMSGQDTVRPDTARRVMAAVEELGYRVHAAAASLASGRTRVLGVIVVSTDPLLVRSSRRRHPAGGRGERIHRDHGGGRRSCFCRVLPGGLRSARTSGRRRHHPRRCRSNSTAPRCGPAPSAPPPPAVSAPHSTRTPRSPWTSARSPVSPWSISSTSDTRPSGTCRGDDYWTETQQRSEAWEQTLRDRGIAPPPVIPADWTPESGYRAGRTIAAIPEVTAVFVSSDEMAFGLIRALHEAGRSVPDDVSVVSVDDIALAAYASPALTTVRQPFEAMGAGGRSPRHRPDRGARGRRRGAVDRSSAHRALVHRTSALGPLTPQVTSVRAGAPTRPRPYGDARRRCPRNRRHPRERDIGHGRRGPENDRERPGKRQPPQTSEVTPAVATASWKSSTPSVGSGKSWRRPDRPICSERDTTQVPPGDHPLWRTLGAKSTKGSPES